MIYVSSIEKAKPGRFRVRPPGMLPDTLGSWVTAYIGKDSPSHKVEKARPTSGGLFPMAYSVEQDPGSHLRPHFHSVDQFQLVVGGGGSIGHHAAECISVHYTGPYSSYGPIKAGPDGIHYLTLSNRWDPGGRYMPESRHELRDIPHKYREVISDPAKVLPDGLQHLTAAASVAVIDRQSDGMGAWLFRAPPLQSITGPDPHSGEGQFWVVLAGGLVHEQEGSMGSLSCLFIPPDEAAYTARAGTDGLEVMVLQFPNRAAR